MRVHVLAGGLAAVLDALDGGVERVAHLVVAADDLHVVGDLSAVREPIVPSGISTTQS